MLCQLVRAESPPHCEKRKNLREKNGVMADKEDALIMPELPGHSEREKRSRRKGPPAR